ncbi:phosphoribosyltransferase-like protein [Sediminicola luteus]|uniref:PRTase-CE domain-containing protein n=1 Tax=Sediminicola luteus TaxID=319238 RepID=A0A2A4G2X4_9FLAO|nr:hypothetical protein [Sediminicola luteus]PCE63027.1 hypothetical protein B7P33_17285 [Sediminicola luteus]
MNSRIEILVNQWASETLDESYREIHAQIRFLSKELFHDYEPIQGQAINFNTRLENWLDNVSSDSDKKNLFKILSHLFYIGISEFNTLYRVAYNELIAKWLIDIENISFNDFSNAKSELNQALKDCWICPITDSLNINSFFHVNNIPSTAWNEMRPQWYGINEEGPDQPKWNSNLQHINNHNINKIILIEDFVGSGSQIEGVVKFLMEKDLDIEVLVIPLINCPKGIEKLNQLSRKFEKLSYKAVIELSESSFISTSPKADEHLDFITIREFINRIYDLTSGGLVPGNKIPYSPFGYRDTGGFLISYSNAPDNTIPVLHCTSKTWVPLFPRHSRN